MTVDEHQSPSTTTTPARTTTTTASTHNSSSSLSSFKTRVGVNDQAFPTITSPTMASTRIPDSDINLLLSIAAARATTFKTTITPKETDTQRRPSDLAGGALWDLKQLTDDALGLDPELVMDDIRLREPEHANRLLLTTPDYYTHPNLEIFPDAEKKAIAQSNYNTLMDTFATNFCTYEAWKVLGLSNASSSSTQQQHTCAIPQISPGTRENDGITPKPQPATISFHILDDMFQTWLVDHRVSTSCLYTRRSPKPMKIKSKKGMAARTSWTYMCRCFKKERTTKGRGRKQSKGEMKPARRLGCRAKFTAFSGISLPLANGADGAGGTDGMGTKSRKKAGVTLIVYEFEHNHDIRHLVTSDKETDRSRDLRLSREKREELSRHIKALLTRGVGIREVAQMLGANAKRCRELRVRGESGSRRRRFGRKDYLTRRDFVEALELLQRMEVGGSLRSLDKKSKVEEAEEESEEEAEVEEEEPEVEEKQSEKGMEKTLEVYVDDDKVEEVSKEQWQMDILRKALTDLYWLKEASGLDPELEEDDPRLQGPVSSTDTNGQQRGSHIYTHPHLEIFRDVRTKQRAQHNYNLIMDSLTTNYFMYGAWILLGLNLPSSTHNPTSTSQLHPPPPRINPITQGSRSTHDGMTPSPSPTPGTLSFHVPNDMFWAWLEDHQAAVGCEFSLIRWAAAAVAHPSSGSGGNGQASEMTARRCLHFVCSRHEAGGAGTTGVSQDSFGSGGGGGCKAQIKAYVGITKPLTHSLGGGNGRMIDVALVVYQYEHNHSLQPHTLRPRPSHSSNSSSSFSIDNAEEEVHRQGRMDRWTEQIKVLLLQGNTLSDTVFLFGGFVRWRRESDFMQQFRRLGQGHQGLGQQGQQGGEVGGKFWREDYFTRGDLSEILKRLISSGGSGGVKGAEGGVGTGEVQQQDDVIEVQEDEEEEKEEEAVNEVEVEPPVLHDTVDTDQEEDQVPENDEEYYFTLDDISVGPFPQPPAYNAYETGSVETVDQEWRQQQEQDLRTRKNVGSSSSVRGGGNDSLSVLKRYLDELDNSEFAACKDQIEELVDSLKVMKPLCDLVPSTGGDGSDGSRGGGDGPQSIKRRRV